MVPDDHARRAMGAYGDDQVLTPNLDQTCKSWGPI